MARTARGIENLQVAWILLLPIGHDGRRLDRLFLGRISPTACKSPPANLVGGLGKPRFAVDTSIPSVPVPPALKKKQVQEILCRKPVSVASLKVHPGLFHPGARIAV